MTYPSHLPVFGPPTLSADVRATQNTNLSSLYNRITEFRRKLDAQATADQATLDTTIEDIKAKYTGQHRVHISTSDKTVSCMKRLLAWKRAATLAVEDFDKSLREEWKVVKQQELLERGQFLLEKLGEYLEVIKGLNREKAEILRQAGLGGEEGGHGTGDDDG